MFESRSGYAESRSGREGPPHCPYMQSHPSTLHSPQRAAACIRAPLELRWRSASRFDRAMQQDVISGWGHARRLRGLFLSRGTKQTLGKKMTLKLPGRATGEVLERDEMNVPRPLVASHTAATGPSLKTRPIELLDGWRISPVSVMRPVSRCSPCRFHDTRELACTELPVPSCQA